MAVFGIALPITLAFEGGYVNDPKDPGGETNLGITMRTFLHTAHPLLGIEPTSVNLKALTPAQAGIIYKANYWNVVRGDDLESQELANNLFDFYVNAGTHSPSLLQRVINDLPTTPPLVVTGVIGDATLAALKSSPVSIVHAKFKQGRIDYYTAFGATHPRFLKGLLKRANAFPDLPPENAAPADLQLTHPVQLHATAAKRKARTRHSSTSPRRDSHPAAHP